jgi:hypothetical protein
LNIVAAVLLAAVGVGLLVFIAHLNNASQRDFIEYWSAGQLLVHKSNPYDVATTLALQRGAGYKGTFPQITYSPPVALFIALPLGLVSANAGLILWMIALLGSLVVSIRLLWDLHGRPNNSLHLLGYCFAPVMACLMFGQLGIFLLIGIVLYLYFLDSRPFIAGAALLLCVLKPHLFMPFAVALLLWIVGRKAWRTLAGFSAALLASTALTLYLDPNVWFQYSEMMRNTGVLKAWVPTLASTLRFLVDKRAVWLQYLPEICACAWALWYFWTRRERWNWMDHGLVVLLVSAICTPYAWFTDESMLLPAVLAGVYRADESKRSIVPFGVIAAVAIVELVAHVPITSWYFLWTTPAWLAWYFYASGRIGARAAG